MIAIKIEIGEIKNTLRGSTRPDSTSVEEPWPARIWSWKVVEQKNGRPTESIIDLICFLSAVKSCFLETPRFEASVSRSDCGKTTAGIRPIVRSRADTPRPVASRGIAWIVWYWWIHRIDRPNEDAGRSATSAAANLRPRHHFAISVWFRVRCDVRVCFPFKLSDVGGV